jgi:hypothetical protein
VAGIRCGHSFGADKATFGDAIIGAASTRDVIWPRERAHPRVTAWIEEMLQTYDDLVDLVRICARNAYLANSNDVAATLWKMAVEYRDKAARLDSGKVPDIGEPPPRLGRSPVLTAIARA